MAAPSYSEADGVLTIAGPAKLTKEMLADIVKIVVVSGGEITGAEDTVSGKTIEIQLGGKISGGDFLGGTVINSGTIMNGTFNGSVTNNNGGEISGGNFTSAAMTNNGRITGGRFPHFEFMLDFDRTYLKITKNADCTDGVGELLGFELSELSSLGVSGVRVESGVCRCPWSWRKTSAAGWTRAGFHGCGRTARRR